MSTESLDKKSTMLVANIVLDGKKFGNITDTHQNSIMSL